MCGVTENNKYAGITTINLSARGEGFGKRCVSNVDGNSSCSFLFFLFLRDLPFNTFLCCAINVIAFERHPRYVVPFRTLCKRVWWHLRARNRKEEEAAKPFMWWGEKESTVGVRRNRKQPCVYGVWIGTFLQQLDLSHLSHMVIWCLDWYVSQQLDLSHLSLRWRGRI